MCQEEASKDNDELLRSVPQFLTHTNNFWKFDPHCRFTIASRCAGTSIISFAWAISIYFHWSHPQHLTAVSGNRPQWVIVTRHLFSSKDRRRKKRLGLSNDIKANDQMFISFRWIERQSLDTMKNLIGSDKTRKNEEIAPRYTDTHSLGNVNTVWTRNRVKECRQWMSGVLLSRIADEQERSLSSLILSSKPACSMDCLLPLKAKSDIEESAISGKRFSWQDPLNSVTAFGEYQKSLKWRKWKFLECCS